MRQQKSSRPVVSLLVAAGLVTAAYLPSVRESSAQEIFMTRESGTGIVTVKSRHSVDETVQKLKQILEAKGIKLFALIDHSGAAKDAGIEMRPTKLLILGNPAAGTPLMIASPTIAIDLPLKILVAEDAEGRAWISWNSPAYLQQRHHVPADLIKNIAVVESLAQAAAE
jgi:uncharacterized protein (DUF302 family)